VTVSSRAAQALREMGFARSAAALEEESTLLEQPRGVAELRDAVLAGDWPAVPARTRPPRGCPPAVVLVGKPLVDRRGQTSG